MADIVVGFDGSSCGESALAEALQLAVKLEDRVVVVFGYAPPGLWGGEIADHEEAIEELERRSWPRRRPRRPRTGWRSRSS